MATFVRPTVQEAAAGVLVRHYPKVTDYTAEASQMGALGWTPQSQIETQGRFPAAAGILMLLGLFGALFVSLIGGLIFIVIAVLIGTVSRQKAFVVTYRYDLNRAPGSAPAGFAE